MIRIKKGIKMRPVILVTSFGTSYPSSRSITIGAIESTIAETFPGFEVRRAFTSNIIRKILKERDGIVIDSVPQALEKLAAEGVREVYIMPTHVMEGEEYDVKIAGEAEKFKGRFDTIKVGHALLTKDADLMALIDAVDEATAEFKDGSTARVFMGHGTEHEANSVYAKLQSFIKERGIKDMFIGTVEATPTLEDTIQSVKKSGAKRVVLSPLMMVAGDHAVNDMAGDDDDSWKSAFKKAGFEVVCRVTGLGSLYGIQKMIAEHCREMTEGAGN